MTVTAAPAVVVQDASTKVTFDIERRPRIRHTDPATGERTVDVSGSGPYQILIQELSPVTAPCELIDAEPLDATAAPLARFAGAHMIGDSVLRMAGDTGRAVLHPLRTYFSSGSITIDGTLTVLEGHRADGTAHALAAPVLVRALVDRH